VNTKVLHLMYFGSFLLLVNISELSGHKGHKEDTKGTKIFHFKYFKSFLLLVNISELSGHKGHKGDTKETQRAQRFLFKVF
jgi:hypothetical protein